MGDLQPISNKHSKIYKISLKEEKTRAIIRGYFLENYKDNISILKLNNNRLTIKVSSAALASDINLNKQNNIININRLILPNKINDLFITIG